MTGELGRLLGWCAGEGRQQPGGGGLASACCLALWGAMLQLSCGDIDGRKVELSAAGVGGAAAGVEVRRELPDPAEGAAGVEPAPGEQVRSGLVVASPALQFAAAVIGQSVPGSIVVSNPTGTVLGGVEASITGQHASEFSISLAGCEAPIPPGGNCSSSLVFTPAGLGRRVASLRLSAENGGSVIVALSGEGLVPGQLTASASGFDFGPQEVGALSAPFDWVITNSGSATSEPLVLVNPSATEFIADTTCGAPLGPGSSCTVSVRFLPAAGGARQGTLELVAGSARVGLALIGSGRFRLTVTRSGGGTGRVRAAAAGIDCGVTCSALLEPGVVELDAVVDNGSNALFAGWSAPGCAGPERLCTVTSTGPTSVDARFLPLENNLIFASSQSYPTDLGGVAAYDAECNRLASSAGINDAAGRAFIAALPDGASGLLQRLGTTARGWVRVDGLPFADEPTHLFAANMNVYYGVEFDERGRRLPLVGVLTGASGADCQGWTSRATAPTTQGSPASGPRWYEAFGADCAGAPAPVYCMGKTRTAALGSLPAFQGKRFWMTNTPYTPGSMTPDQKCLAERPVGVSEAVALITYTDRAASVLIDPTATYVRPDGQLIGTGAQVLSLAMVGGPWVFANGSMTAGIVSAWTGGGVQLSVVGSAETTCDNWQNPEGTGNAGAYGFSNRRAWFFELSTPCNGPFARHLYCVEP